MSERPLDQEYDDTEGEVSVADDMKQKKSDDFNAALGQDYGDERQLERSRSLELKPDLCDPPVSSSKCWLQTPRASVTNVKERTRDCPSTTSLVPVTKNDSNLALCLHVAEDSEVDCERDIKETIQIDFVRKSVRYTRVKESNTNFSDHPSSSAALMKSRLDLPQRGENCFPQCQKSCGISDNNGLPTVTEAVLQQTINNSKEGCWLQTPKAGVTNVEERTRDCPSTMSLVPVTKNDSNPALCLHVAEDSEVDCERDFKDTLQIDSFQKSVRYIRVKESNANCSDCPSSSAALIDSPLDFQQRGENFFPQCQKSCEISNNHGLPTPEAEVVLQRTSNYSKEDIWRKIRNSRISIPEPRHSSQNIEYSIANPTSLGTTDSIMSSTYPKPLFNKSSPVSDLLDFKVPSLQKAFNWKNIKNKLHSPRNMPAPVLTGDHRPDPSKIDERSMIAKMLKGANLGGENTPRMNSWARLKKDLVTKKILAMGAENEGQGSPREKTSNKFGLGWVQKALSSMKKANEEDSEEKPVYPVDTYNTILDKEM